MPGVFAEINPGGDRVEIWFRYDPDLVALIKEVPSSQYRGRDEGGPYWLVPLNYDHLKRLHDNVPGLVLGRALKQWIKEDVQRRKKIQHLSSLDSVDVKDLKLGQKIPALAEWMRGYQRADVSFMATTSCLNANEPGLGKTSETIAAIFEAGLEEGPHLVVAPKTSLETVWRMEIERWTAELDQPHEVITYSGDMTKAARERAIDEFWTCVDEDWPVWFVCTSDTVRLGNEPGGDDFVWKTFTIDEFHKTGLPSVSGKYETSSKFSQAVCFPEKGGVRSERRYALSGTPMGGKPIKLWGALRFLYPNLFTSKWQWAKLWLEVNNNGFGNDIGGIQRGKEDEFYAALAPYFVRRLKSEVLTQLPPKQYVEVWCDMTSKQAKQYEQFAASAEATIDELELNAIGILAEYGRLKVFADAYCAEMTEKQIKCHKCDGTGLFPEVVEIEDDEGKKHKELNYDNMVDCPRCLGSGLWTLQHPIPSPESGKLQALLERLQEQGIDPEDPSGDACAIVASQFKEVVYMVANWLNAKGIKAETITGDTKGVERARVQRLFQEGGEDAPRVVVMTTTTGGVSITLDRADTVHILDETWNPDDQLQFEDRAHRASRMHQVTVYYYRSKGTIEEQILKTVTDKANINKEILDVRRQGFRAVHHEA